MWYINFGWIFNLWYDTCLLYTSGEIIALGFKGEVLDVKKLPDKRHIHFVKVVEGELLVGNEYELVVNRNYRLNIEKNHTATHLLNKALRQQVGTHIKQAGSLVTDDKLRFDITHLSLIHISFDSNEALLTKVQSGSTPYDIIIPSDYMINKMRKLNLIKKLDHSKLEGLDNIDPQFLDKVFDPGNEYSIPYFWGTLGILYNKTKVPEDLKFDKWNDLWDSRLQNNILAIDGAVSYTHLQR